MKMPFANYKALLEIQGALIAIFKYYSNFFIGV